MTVKRSVLAIALALALAGAVLYAGRDAAPLLREAMAAIENSGPLGPLLFIALYVVACVAMIPGSALTLGAGAVWGLGEGALLVAVGAMLGATAAFLVGRHFAGRWVGVKIAANPKLAALDEAVAKDGWRIVFLTRLAPVFPFNLLNYALGLTSVRLTDYLTASFLGMIPGIAMFTYLGTLAGDLVGGVERQPPSALTWAFRIVGFAATALVTVYIAKIAKKALSEKI